MRSFFLGILVVVAPSCGSNPSPDAGVTGGGGSSAGGVGGGTSAGGAAAGGNAGASVGGGVAGGDFGGAGGGRAAGGSGGGTSGGAPAGGLAAGGTSGGVSGGLAGGMAGGNPFEGVDPLAGISAVERVDGGFRFTEGPQWVPALGALLFSDIPNSRILQMTPPRSFREFLSPSQNSNGIALAPNGDLIVCQHAGQVSRRSPDGGMSVVANRFDGGTLNSPNDAVVRSDGTIYFTDPTYGATGSVGFRGLYRLSPNGTLTLEYSTRNGQPNGVTFSPDESVLYLADSQLSEVRRFNVGSSGALSNEARFTLVSAGGPGGSGGDGITTDVNGNLYVSASVGIKVYRPDAGYLGRIPVPENPTNCAFAEPDHRVLYITAQTSLYRVRLNVPGPY